MSDNCCFVVAGVVVGIGALLLVILLPISFSGLEYYEIGLLRQKSTGTVSVDEVYGGGKHFVGPDYEFKAYQATAHFVDLEGVSVFEKGKMPISINVYFQYFIRKDDLPTIHKKYDINYENVMRKSATTALKNEATNWTRWQMIKERAKVEAALFKAVRDRLGGTCCLKHCSSYKFACPKTCLERSKCVPDDEGLGVNVKYFQFGKVVTDSQVERAMLDAEIRDVDAEVEVLVQKAIVVRKKTNTLVQQIKDQAKEARQEAVAQAALINTVSKANYTLLVERARSEGLKSLYNVLKISGEPVKNSFDYLRTLRGLDNVHFTVDFQQRIVGGIN